VQGGYLAMQSTGDKLDENECALYDSAREILGIAAVTLLKKGSRATPGLIYTLVLSWEEGAETREKPAYQLALKILSKKLN